MIIKNKFKVLFFLTFLFFTGCIDQFKQHTVISEIDLPLSYPDGASFDINSFILDKKTDIINWQFIGNNKVSITCQKGWVLADNFIPANGTNYKAVCNLNEGCQVASITFRNFENETDEIITDNQNIEYGVYKATGNNFEGSSQFLCVPSNKQSSLSLEPF